MTIFKQILLFLLCLSTSAGCATLPNVSDKIDEAPAAQQPRQIVSSKGRLSPQQSKAVMERLKKSVDPTDILERHIAVVESVTESPLTNGNKITLLADGQAAYAAMFKIIQSAKDHIHVQSYIIEDDETGRKFSEMLLHKQAKGVQVRILYDSVGSMKTPAAFFKHLKDGGIEVVEFNPVNPLETRGSWWFTHRDHRKILIVDNRVAIMGGINISKVYSSTPFKRKKNEKPPIHWRDTDIQIEGPAVAQFQKLFLETWLKQKGPEYKVPIASTVIPKGNALVRVVSSTPGETNRIPFIMYVSAIAFAERSIHITNSYFFPDDQIIEALTDAAGRGVDVKIILPGITDSALALHAQRHYYSELLRSGVKLYEHKSSLLHAKTAVIDDVWSTVGSTNMDYLSLLNNDEVNAVILNKDFADQMEKMFAKDLADSRQINRDEWKKRPVLPRLREWAVSLFVRWL